MKADSCAPVGRLVGWCTEEIKILYTGSRSHVRACYRCTRATRAQAAKQGRSVERRPWRTRRRTTGRHRLRTRCPLQSACNPRQPFRLRSCCFWGQARFASREGKAEGAGERARRVCVYVCLPTEKRRPGREGGANFCRSQSSSVLVVLRAPTHGSTAAGTLCSKLSIQFDPGANLGA